MEEDCWVEEFVGAFGTIYACYTNDGTIGCGIVVVDGSCLLPYARTGTRRVVSVVASWLDEGSIYCYSIVIG